LILLGESVETTQINAV